MHFHYPCFSNTNASRIPTTIMTSCQDICFCRWMKGFGYTLRFFCFIFLLGFGYTLGFLCFRFLAFGSYFTQVHLKKKGSFEQQQRCIFFNFPCVRLTRIRFLFFFLLRLYLWKKKFVAACVWFHVLFLLLLCSLDFFPTLHRCISRRKVHLNKKGAFFSTCHVLH